MTEFRIIRESPSDFEVLQYFVQKRSRNLFGQRVWVKVYGRESLRKCEEYVDNNGRGYVVVR